MIVDKIYRESYKENRLISKYNFPSLADENATKRLIKEYGITLLSALFDRWEIAMGQHSIYYSFVQISTSGYGNTLGDACKYKLINKV